MTDDRQTFAIGETIRQKHLDAVARDAATIDALRTRIAELEEALRPFAEVAERIRPNDPDNDRPAYATVADYRHARATLNGEKG